MILRQHTHLKFQTYGNLTSKAHTAFSMTYKQTSNMTYKQTGKLNSFMKTIN